MQYGSPTPVNSMVFHRILDLKRGRMSIQPLFFSPPKIFPIFLHTNATLGTSGWSNYWFFIGYWI